MSISTKNSRQFVFNNRKFVWRVSGDGWLGNMILHVVSEDKKFAVNYALAQSNQTRHLEISGEEFTGLTDAARKTGRTRVLCPKFEDDFTITPAVVRRLIEWSLSEKLNFVIVDFDDRQSADN